MSQAYRIVRDYIPVLIELIRLTKNLDKLQAKKFKTPLGPSLDALIQQLSDLNNLIQDKQNLINSFP